MGDKLLINLDKLLIEMAYTAEITEKKNKITRLEENIRSSNGAIADLRKQNESSKKNCNVWKPTYEILSKHEEYVKSELEALEEATENERKMYEDYITQYNEVLQEHRKKYAGTALAQKYHKKNEEVEGIQNTLLKRWEKYKWKEDAGLDVLGTATINAFTVKPIGSALHIEVSWLQKLLYYAVNHQTLEETTEDHNNSEMIENQKSLEKPEEFKERMFEEHEHTPLPTEKHPLCKPLHVPSIPRKLVQSVQSIRFSKHRPETGREGKQNPVELPVTTTTSSGLAENLSEMVIDTAGTNNSQIAQVPSIASIQTPVKFRLTNPPKQLTSSQQFESENAVMASQEAKRGDKEADKPKESSYIPQTEENFPVGNLNSLSPHKDIGSFFGKPEGEDAFAFPFASESTSHAFGDGKDDFSFPFAFGQDQRSSQSPSMKGFHSSLQNTKPFTLF
ncbi:hypothetical protein WISP_85186 [Willisornis vidua]|uniref:Protein SIX6OS1 n=1 Tax=Willisornis vidua TaxID=1566151 RepID=A0ABQ9D3B5_9PASS|nr:hypothetical protein WISP_85186 [Willisornis vidua]